jgi:hypothetical protein
MLLENPIPGVNCQRRMHARNRRKLDVRFRHQRMICYSWITTRRRSDAFADPMIQSNEKGPQSPGIFVPIRLLPTFTLGWEVNPWNMLRTGNQIDTDICRGA